MHELTRSAVETARRLTPGLAKHVIAAASLGFSGLSYSDTIYGGVSAGAYGQTGQKQQSVQQTSLSQTLIAHADATATTYTYNNGVPIPLSDTSNADIQAVLATGSLALNARAKSGGLVGYGGMPASASANLEFEAPVQSVWTLAWTDHTTRWAAYDMTIVDPTGQNVWYGFKYQFDPARSGTVSLTLGPGLYRFVFNFGAGTDTDTGSDAGSLSLTMTSPVPLPASVWLLGSVCGLLWAAALVARRGHRLGARP